MERRGFIAALAASIAALLTGKAAAQPREEAIPRFDDVLVSPTLRYEDFAREYAVPGWPAHPQPWDMLMTEWEDAGTGPYTVKIKTRLPEVRWRQL